METLRLTLRGLRWRFGASLSVFLVAVVAMAGAALGPLYAHSAAESLVRESLANAAPAATGIDTRAVVAGQTQFTPEEILESVVERADASGLDRWFLPSALSMRVRNGAPSLNGHQLGVAEIGWHEGQCEAVTVTEGRCPTAAGEAMVSTRTAEMSHLRIGDVIRLGTTGDADADTAAIVGMYDLGSADPAVWGLGGPNQAEPARGLGGPDRLDEILTDRTTLERSRGDVAATSFRPIDPTVVNLDDLPALTTAVVAATNPVGPSISSGPRTSSTSGLPAYLQELQSQLDGVGAASFAVTAQFVLLAWFVLFLIVSAMSEERSGEIALAKLRGMGPRSTVAFGLGEPVLLILIAVPIGLAIGYGVDLALSSQYLVAGSRAVLTPLTLVSLGVCLLGGAAAAALAARGILTAPVLDQLKRSGGSRARLARSTAIDAVAIALAAAGVYQLRRGESDVLALMAPGLIALAVGLLAARSMPLLARTQVRRTRRSAHVAGFLASRNIARRPAGLRVLVLLSLAIGLAVFAVDGWVVAASNRIDLARAQVGAHQVLDVRAASPGALLAAVDAADPGGRDAMAAVTASDGQGTLLAVDSERLASVAAWDPAWIGFSMSELKGWLHPPSAAAPVPIRDSLAMDASLSRESGDAVVDLGVVVRDADGRSHELALGTLPAGTSSPSVALPMCEVNPCSLVAFTFRQPIDRPSSSLRAEVDLGNAVDADGPIELGSAGIDGWRAGVSSSDFPIEAGAEVTRLGDREIHLLIDVDRGDAGVEVADHPSDLPIVQGSEDAPDLVAGGVTRVTGLDGRPLPTTSGASGVLPRLLSRGAVADLRYAVASMGSASAPLDYQVWLSATAPMAIRAALETAGVTVTGEDSTADRVSELDGGGETLALRLFLIMALAAVGLAAGTLATNAYIMIRRRAYELAAVKALGASHALLVRAGRREQLILVSTGVALGLASGLVAASAVLPALARSSGADGPPQWFGPAWVPVLGFTILVLGLFAVISDVSARSTARRAHPDLLRQVQE